MFTNHPSKAVLNTQTNSSNDPKSKIPYLTTDIWHTLTLCNRRDLVRLCIRNLDPELLFNSHDDLDGVERVEAEVGGECRRCGELRARAKKAMSVELLKRKQIRCNRWGGDGEQRGWNC